MKNWSWWWVSVPLLAVAAAAGVVAAVWYGVNVQAWERYSQMHERDGRGE